MKNTVKEFIKTTPVYAVYKSLRLRAETIDWELRGRPAPPPHPIKQRAIREYASRYGLKILVETGTFYGDMVAAMKNTFDKIYSIELSDELFVRAQKRFESDRHIEILHGDSGVELGKLMATLDRPTLFWLDGHYSAGNTARGDKDTPVIEELTHIFDSPPLGHVVIIDDARCFGHEPGYPSLDTLREFVKENRPRALIEVENDSVRIVLDPPLDA